MADTSYLSNEVREYIWTELSKKYGQEFSRKQLGVRTGGNRRLEKMITYLRIPFFVCLFIFFLFINSSSVSAFDDWNVVNSFYNPDGCPVSITDVESHWQDYRPPRYNRYGMRLKKELLPGIWCKVHFTTEDANEAPADQPILGVKYGVWYFNVFEELLGVYTAYATDGPYEPDKGYSAEWLTNDEAIGATHYRTIIFPYQIRFEDGTWWHADFKEIYQWALETLGWDEINPEELFPPEIFEYENDEYFWEV